MSEPIRHHYVPQFHLRQWVEDDGRVQAWLRKPDGELLRARLRPENTAFENRLYSYAHAVDPQLVERHLGEYIEHEAAPLLRRMIDEGPDRFWPSERNAWARFLIAARLRVPEEVVRLKGDAAEVLRKQLADDHAAYLAAGGTPDSTLTEWVEKTYVGLIDSFGVVLLPSLFEDREAINNLTSLIWWTVDLAAATRPLLLTDRPAWVTGNPITPTGLIAMPLSPTCAFFAASSRAIQEHICAQPPSALVRLCNTSLVQQAARAVYGDAEEKFINRWLKPITL